MYTFLLLLNISKLRFVLWDVIPQYMIPVKVLVRFCLNESYLNQYVVFTVKLRHVVTPDSLLYLIFQKFDNTNNVRGNTLPISLSFHSTFTIHKINYK